VLTLSFKIVLAIYDVLFLVSFVLHIYETFKPRSRIPTEDSLEEWYEDFNLVMVIQEFLLQIFIILMFKLFFQFKRVYY